MRRYDEAIQFCQQQLAGSPRCVTFRLLRAQALFALGDRANAVAELQRCLRIDSTCQAARTLLDAVATVEEQLRQEQVARGEAPRVRRDEPRRRRDSARVQPRREEPPPREELRVQVQPQRREQPRVQVQQQPQRREQPRVQVQQQPQRREQPRAQVQPQPQRREEPRVQVQPQPQRREPARASVVLQPLAQAVPRPVPAAPRHDQAEILSLFDDDADIPTDVKRPPRPVQRPATSSFDPLAIEPSIRRAEPRPRIVIDPEPRIGINPLPPVAVEPLPPIAPVRVAPLPRVAPRPEPRIAVDPPHRRAAAANAAAVAAAGSADTPSRRRQSRPAFDPPSTPPRRATAADDSAPLVLPQRPRRAATSWQRPLSIETRKPLSRPALIAVGLLGLAALWLVRPDTPSQLPSASLATAARPAPEPPVAKVEKPSVPDLVPDIWIHPLAGPERRMPIHDSRLFGAERLGDRPEECRGGHCGIDLAGRYGEPVYAVHDGVIDRVQRAANEDHGGHYVRLTHNDGTIITQYFHLSSIPRRLEEGAHVKAGELLGWIGLSGVKHSEPHLHFTVSVQDPSGADGRYLDPEPLVALWPLRLPDKDRLRLATTTPPGLARGFIRRRHHHRARTVETAPAAE